MPNEPTPEKKSANSRRIFVLGATGTIGRATVRALVDAGHSVVCFVRQSYRETIPEDLSFNGVEVRFGNPTDIVSLREAGFGSEHYDCVVSCIASRTGVPADAWAVDFKTNDNALHIAQDLGIGMFVLLSAICVQKPLLEFQKAKLAFEEKLVESGLTYSIVRPTAFFKSLSGQLDRVTQGKPFLVFGDGRLTACKPISDHDLAKFMVACIEDDQLHNRILPIGGPGEAFTPHELGTYMFELTGQKPRFRRVPVKFLDTVIFFLDLLAHVVPPLKAKAELARIGRYYGTESMLLLDPNTGSYDADATPSTGKDTIVGYLKRLLDGDLQDQRAEHKVF